MTTQQAADKKFEALIIYNGVERPVDAQAQEAVQALLEQAMNVFGVHQNRHLMALWFIDPAQEIPNDKSVKDAGITAQTKLLLRPSAVRAGTC